MHRLQKDVQRLLVLYSHVVYAKVVQMNRGLGQVCQRSRLRALSLPITYEEVKMYLSRRGLAISLQDSTYILIADCTPDEMSYQSDVVFPYSQLMSYTDWAKTGLPISIMSLVPLYARRPLKPVEIAEHLAEEYRMRYGDLIDNSLRYISGLSTDYGNARDHVNHELLRKLRRDSGLCDAEWLDGKDLDTPFESYLKLWIVRLAWGKV
jgi:hypothetical protein